MTPEELAEARHYAACYQAGYVHDLMHNLLDHIDQQAARIAELEDQVAALKKIAEEERAYIYSLNVIESMGVDEHMRTEASRQLIEEHPEAFCPPAESDWGVTCRRTTYRTLHTPAPLTGRSDDPL